MGGGRTTIRTCHRQLPEWPNRLQHLPSLDQLLRQVLLLHRSDKRPSKRIRQLQRAMREKARQHRLHEAAGDSRI